MLCILESTHRWKDDIGSFFTDCFGLAILSIVGVGAVCFTANSSVAFRWETGNV